MYFAYIKSNACHILTYSEIRTWQKGDTRLNFLIRKIVITLLVLAF